LIYIRKIPYRTKIIDIKFHVKQSYAQFHVKPTLHPLTYPHLVHIRDELWIDN